MGLPYLKAEKWAAAGTACVMLVPHCTQAKNLLQETWVSLNFGWFPLGSWSTKSHCDE